MAWKRFEHGGIVGIGMARLTRGRRIGHRRRYHRRPMKDAFKAMRAALAAADATSYRLAGGMGYGRIRQGVRVGRLRDACIRANTCANGGTRNSRLNRCQRGPCGLDQNLRFTTVLGLWVQRLSGQLDQTGPIWVRMGTFGPNTRNTSANYSFKRRRERLIYLPTDGRVRGKLHTLTSHNRY